MELKLDFKTVAWELPPPNPQQTLPGKGISRQGSLLPTQPGTTSSMPPALSHAPLKITSRCNPHGSEVTSPTESHPQPLESCHMFCPPVLITRSWHNVPQGSHHGREEHCSLLCQLLKVHVAPHAFAALQPAEPVTNSATAVMSGIHWVLAERYSAATRMHMYRCQIVSARTTTCPVSPHCQHPQVVYHAPPPNTKNWVRYPRLLKRHTYGP